MASVAIIISTYNRVKALQLTLDSILCQSKMPDEIVVADDGSTSETAELVEHYKNKLATTLIHCWHPDEGFRAAAIRNKAMALCVSEYIISVDGDLILHKHFVRDHLRTAEQACFVQGSRVLLSEKLTTEIEQQKDFPSLHWYSNGIKNRLNAMYIPVISDLLTQKKKLYSHMQGIRSCNMAFWKNDIVEVNGFNEDFVGWGREDSELVIRFMNNSIQRKNLKFGGIVFHLFHHERSRNSLNQNDSLMDETIRKNLRRCDNGIDKYLQNKKNI